MLNAKQTWILKWVINNGSVDILNSDFVQSYIDTFKVPYVCQLYGASTCKDLSSTLSEMFKKGLLSRQSVGLPWGNLPSGFPKWVYVYSLPYNP